MGYQCSKNTHDLALVAACRYVDEVFPEHHWDQKIADVKKYNATIFAMGDDWQGKFDFLEEHCQVIYLPRTNNVSTTKTKKQLSSINWQELDALDNALHSAIDILKTLKHAQ
ncbi:MAG: hypothetical protein ACRCYV_01905 [Aeromonas sp.]